MAAKRKPRPVLDQNKEAIRWFRNRVPMRKDEWLELDRKARERAFTVAHITKLDIINDTLKALTRALQTGETLEQFKARVGNKLERAWGEERAWHLEVIFRNNMQQGYAHGREMQMRTEEALELRPYGLFSAALDGNTTDICKKCHGTVLPLSHRWWQTHTPLLHHQCRSIKRALTPEQAEARGISKRGPKSDAQEGFGGADPLDWEPDLSRYPPSLVKEYRRKRK